MIKSLIWRSCCLILSMVLLASALVACGQKEEKRYEEFLVVDVFDSQANYQGLQSGWYAKIIKDKFNMQLNIIAPNVAGGGDTLYKIRFAAGNLGDIIISTGERCELQDLVDAGLLYDMSSSLTGKDIMTYKEAIASLHEGIEQEGIYAIPSEVSRLSADTPSDGPELTFGPYVRWDVYAAIGYPEIPDLDSLLEILKQLQEAVPEAENGNRTYAFSLFKDWDGNMMNSAKQPACLYGYDEVGFILAKADGSDYQDIVRKDSLYMKALELFHKAQLLGLVDPDSSVQSYEEVFVKYEQGEILFSFWPWQGQSAYNTDSNMREGKGFMLAPLEDMQILTYGCNPRGNHKSFIAVGSQAKDPERLVDFVDWLYSPEGIMVSAASSSGGAAGPMGLTWEMQDGMPVLTDFGKQAFYSSVAQVPEEWGGGTWGTGISQLNFKPVSQVEISPSGFTYYFALWESVLGEEDKLLQTDWKNHMGAGSTIEYLEKNNQILVAPGCSFVVPEESTDIVTKRSQCRKVIVDYSWKMVYAADEDEFWDIYEDMCAMVYDLGYQDVLEVDLNNARLQNESRKEALQ